MKHAAIMHLIACVFVIANASVAFAGIEIAKSADRLDIRIDQKPFATYVWSDPKIPRPYFANVHAPNGVQVTRSYPIDPVVNKGNDDHDTFHPGIWLAFGDVNTMDVWRNKARVWHAHFVEEPGAPKEPEHATFTVLNTYEATSGPDDNTFYESCRYDVYALDIGWFIISQSAFQSRKGTITFGDQEEMGLGVRLQTPLTVKLGSGAILNSEKGRNEYGTWGFPAKWCSYYGKTEKGLTGVTVMPGPENFRPSWFHTRDYGLMVANPFGKKALTAAKNPDIAPDATIVPNREVFRLTFGILLFASDGEPDNATAYDWFTELLSQSEPPKPPMTALEGIDIETERPVELDKKDEGGALKP
jgi:hypothetical protein